MANISPTSKRSYLFIEVLRIIACLFVIFNHTGGLGFLYFTNYEPASPRFWIYLFPSIFCKAAVYLYFAITGALLLSKDEDLSAIWKKRILKVVAALFIFSLFRYSWNTISAGQSINFMEFLRTFYENGVGSSMWYMYAHLALLVCLPFLGSLVKGMKDKEFIYMMAIGLVFMCIKPFFEYYTGLKLNSNFSVSWLLSNIVFYPCLGYFLHHRFDATKHARLILPLWLINIATIAFSCYSTYHFASSSETALTSQTAQVFHNQFVMVNTITLFLTSKYLFERFTCPQWLSTFLTTVGGCTYGTYLIHEWLLYDFVPFRAFWWNLPWNLNIPVFAATVLSCFITLLIGTVVTLLLKRLPVFRKIL